MSTPSMPIDGSSLSDEELVQRMTRGDENALRTLVQRQGARLAFLARRILGASATEEDVEEVVSDTFLHAWNTSEAYDPERALVRTWLGWLLIARGLPKRRSLLRLQRLHEAVTQRAASEITIDDTYNQIEERADAYTQLQLALKLLRETAPVDAELLSRRYFEQQTPAEIARDLGISDSHARVRLFRALHKLRKILSAE
jgi:RNA polymerase sigma-70 factor, ECF subfamily